MRIWQFEPALLGDIHRQHHLSCAGRNIRPLTHVTTSNAPPWKAVRSSASTSAALWHHRTRPLSQHRQQRGWERKSTCDYCASMDFPPSSHEAKEVWSPGCIALRDCSWRSRKLAQWPRSARMAGRENEGTNVLQCRWSSSCTFRVNAVSANRITRNWGGLGHGQLRRPPCRGRHRYTLPPEHGSPPPGRRLGTCPPAETLPWCTCDRTGHAAPQGPRMAACLQAQKLPDV